MKDRSFLTLPVLTAFAIGIGIGIAGTWFLGQGNPKGNNSHLAESPPGVAGNPDLRRPSNASAAAPVSPGSPPEAGSTSLLPSAGEGTPARDSADTLDAIQEAVTKQSTSGKLEYLSLLQSLTPEDAPKMLDVFRELSYLGYKVADYDRLFWERWAEIDGKAASETMFERDKRFKETGLSKLAISTWAKSDPKAASEWLFSQEDIPLREGMIKGLLEGMAERDLDAARELLATANLTTAQKAHGYVQVARQFQIQKGLDAAGDWLQAFPDDDPVSRELAINAVTQVYSRAPFEKALGWADTLEGSTDFVMRTRLQLHARLARGRPDGLVAHLGTDSNAATLTGVEPLVQGAVDRWITTNPNAMGIWLQKNREIENYDLVTAPFVQKIATRDFEAAEAWADTIRDPGLRDRLKQSLARLGASVPAQ